MWRSRPDAEAVDFTAALDESLIWDSQGGRSKKGRRTG